MAKLKCLFEHCELAVTYTLINDILSDCLVCGTNGDHIQCCLQTVVYNYSVLINCVHHY